MTKNTNLTTSERCLHKVLKLPTSDWKLKICSLPDIPTSEGFPRPVSISIY